MSSRGPNHQWVKIHHSYTVDEAARLMRAHKNTIRNWIRQGLPVLPGCRPALIHGAELKAFLQKRRLSAKQACGPGRLYCLKCRAPQRPAEAMVDFLQTRPASGMLRAICGCCGTLMHRRVRSSEIDAVMPGIRVLPMHNE